MNDKNPAELTDLSKASKNSRDTKASASEPDEVKKLQESFDRVYVGPNKLRHEYDLQFEAKQIHMEIEDYRRLYELQRRDLTGFGEKKLWDILQLIIVPLFLAGVAVYLPYASKQSEQAQAEDRNRQESLNKYFDTMTNLLLESKLKTSKEGAEIRTIVRAKTLTTLDGLDGYRKGQLLRFLQEAQLIRDDGLIVSLRGADLRSVNILTADLSKADLTRAILTDAELDHANFSNANLTKTVLHRANLEGASFTDANLKGAVLAKATLKKTDFTGADLKGAFFTGADLSAAKPFSEEQLGQAKFCHTTMPDGKRNDQNCEELNKMDLNDFYNSYLSP
jgi:uncharacterized protein YjbI with pentapeptide repeats